VITLLDMIETTTVLAIGWNETCGQPLKYWLLVYTGRQLIVIPLRIFVFRMRNNPNTERRMMGLQILRVMSILTFISFLVGQSFLFTGKSCQNSAPVLWYYCLTVIIIVYISLALPFLIVLAICICLPCVLIVFRFFAEPEGANTEAIKNLPTREFKKSDALTSKPKKKKEDDTETKKDDGHVSDEEEENENAPGCAVCMADYDDGDVLNTLPCGHEFHKECVAKWLPIKKICPLCRQDITRKGANSIHNNQDNRSNRANSNNADNNNRSGNSSSNSAANNNNNNNVDNNNARVVEGNTLEQA